MNLPGFKLRTAKILNQLNPRGFTDAIDEFNSIEPLDGIGYSEFKAKVEVMVTALSNIFLTDYYESVLASDHVKLKLIESIFVDIYSSNPSKQKVLADGLETLKHLTDFLAKSRLHHPIYAERAANAALSITATDADSIPSKNYDEVDQDETKVRKLKPGDAMGTTGLATCIGICIVNRTPDNQPLCAIGHDSFGDGSMLEDMHEEIRERFILPRKTDTFIVGGSIFCMADLCDLIMRIELEITDMRICTNDLAQGQSSGVFFSADRLGQVSWFVEAAVPQKRKLSDAGHDAQPTLPVQKPVGVNTKKFFSAVRVTAEDKLSESAALQRPRI